MSKDKDRRLKHLMANQYVHPVYFDNWKKTTLELAVQQTTGTRISKDLENQIEIYKLAKELEISDDDLKKRWIESYSKQCKQTELYGDKPKKEGRDNKDVLVGSGGSSGNKIRYPSKKRSLSTWKKFYKLFPICAELDGFDGKSSKRMK
jgi:hypothetical protein